MWLPARQHDGLGFSGGGAAQLDAAALVGQLGGRDILLPANDKRPGLCARISGQLARLHGARFLFCLALPNFVKNMRCLRVV